MLLSFEQKTLGLGLLLVSFTYARWFFPSILAFQVCDPYLILKQVLKKVEVEITSKEDSWAMRLINFITGARQMLSEGMTRELPV